MFKPINMLKPSAFHRNSKLAKSFFQHPFLWQTKEQCCEMASFKILAHLHHHCEQCWQTEKGTTGRQSGVQAPHQDCALSFTSRMDIKNGPILHTALHPTLHIH